MELVQKIYDKATKLKSELDNVQIYPARTWENNKYMNNMMSAIEDNKLEADCRFVVWTKFNYFIIVFTDDRFVFLSYTIGRKKVERSFECRYDELQFTYINGKEYIYFKKNEGGFNKYVENGKYQKPLENFFDDIIAIANNLDTDIKVEEYYVEMCKKEVEKTANIEIGLLNKCLVKIGDNSKYNDVKYRANMLIAYLNCNDMLKTFFDNKLSFCARCKKYYKQLDKLYRITESYSIAFAYFEHISIAMATNTELQYDYKKISNLGIDISDVVEDCFKKINTGEMRYNFPKKLDENEKAALLLLLGKYYQNPKLGNDTEKAVICYKGVLEDYDYAIKLDEYNDITYFMAICIRDGLGKMEYDEAALVNLLYEGANRNYGLSEYELYRYYERQGDDRANAFKDKAAQHGVKGKFDYEKFFKQTMQLLNTVEGITWHMNGILTQFSNMGSNAVKIFETIDPVNFKTIHQNNTNAYTDTRTQGLISKQKENGQKAINNKQMNKLKKKGVV